ncbi:amidohydrolase family protein [Ceratobasidium sp. AG-Ba]|nr:amidohydrolase family protein [Ceratobasidium sp. AG-Ba]QRW04660.1 amidohydrolase family protein [Ceratobasidium sp. AG-Ba]
MLSRARSMLVDDGDGESLIVLEGKDSGRPVGGQYWDRAQKLAFMDKHSIDISVVSTANPWLDFLTPPEAPKLAQELNQDLEEYCASGPSLSSRPSTPTSPACSVPQIKRLYGFGLLPLLPSVPTSQITEVINQIASLPHLRGVIMGTKGLGKGLDDPELEPVWAAIAEKGLVIFLHPHYGVPDELFGEAENGHVLPLALGFPFETAIASLFIYLLPLCTLDRHPTLRILLAHSGGALPILSSRLASCIAHDPLVASRLQHDARHYLGMLYYDAVAYGAPELMMASAAAGRGSNYSSENKGERTEGIEAWSSIGSKRMMFGTDHPFFPPIPGVAEPDGKWASVTENLAAIQTVHGWSEADKEGVRGGNAVRIFGLV